MKPSCQSTMAWLCPSLSKILLVLLIGTSNKVTGRCKTAGTCPSGWDQWGNQCYRKTESNLPWAEARDECVEIGGVMTAPHSRSEESYLLSWTSGGEIWINCNDITLEGSWECKEGTTTVDYRRWASEPDNNGGGENCAGLLEAGWNDIACTWNRPTVCKRPIPTVWV